MGVVTIRCPKTGVHVSVGLEVAPEAFKSLRPGVARMRCPACGSEHVWSKGMAWLDLVSLPPAAPTAPQQSASVDRFEEKLTSHGLRSRLGRLEADRRSKVASLVASWRTGPARKRDAASDAPPDDGGSRPLKGPVKG